MTSLTHTSSHRKFVRGSAVTVVILILLGTGVSSPATATDSQDIIYVDGQPCGAFCRSWMGIARRPIAPPAVLTVLPDRVQDAYRVGKSDIRKPRRELTRRMARAPLPKPRPSISFTKIDIPEQKLSVIKRDTDSPFAKADPGPGRETDVSMPSQHSTPLLEAATPEAARLSSQSAASEVDTLTLGPTSSAGVTVSEQPTEQPAIAFAAPRELPSRSSAPGDVLDVRHHQDEIAADQLPAANETETSSINVDKSASLRSTVPEHERLAAMLPLPPKPSVAPVSTKPSTPLSVSGQGVAILIARPEISSLSDLISRDVAIDARQSAARESVRMALSVAGASDVRLTGGAVKALDRLMGGEVQAAVLALVSAAAADDFPNIAGFKIFRVPLGQ